MGNAFFYTHLERQVIPAYVSIPALLRNSYLRDKGGKGVFPHEYDFRARLSAELTTSALRRHANRVGRLSDTRDGRRDTRHQFRTKSCVKIILLGENALPAFVT